MARQYPPRTNTRKELKRCCLPIGHNNTKHFCDQSGAGIRLTVWKWYDESRYPGALPPVLEDFLRAFSPVPTDCPQVPEDQSSGKKLCLPEIFQGSGIGAFLHTF